MKRHKNDTRPSSVKSAGTDFLTLQDACLKVFNKYDVDNSGSLTHIELRNVVREELRLSNRIIPEDELKEMFLHMGGEGDGQARARAPPASTGRAGAALAHHFAEEEAIVLLGETLELRGALGRATRGVGRRHGRRRAPRQLHTSRRHRANARRSHRREAKGSSHNR